MLSRAMSSIMTKIERRVSFRCRSTFARWDSIDNALTSCKQMILLKLLNNVLSINTHAYFCGYYPPQMRTVLL